MVNVHYMYAARGTIKPTVAQIVSKADVEADVTQSFGSGVTDDDAHYIKIDLNGLSVHTEYIMYIVGSDQSGNLTENVEEISFKTL